MALVVFLTAFGTEVLRTLYVVAAARSLVWMATAAGVATSGLLLLCSFQCFEDWSLIPFFLAGDGLGTWLTLTIAKRCEHGKK